MDRMTSQPMPLPPDRERDAWPRHFAAAFENAVIGMTLLGTDSRWLTVNRAFCEFLGYAEAQLLGSSLQDIVHPDDLEDDRRQLAALLGGEKDSYRRETRYLHRRGHVLWGDCSCTLARDAQGRPLFFITQVQDITERSATEDALRESEERFRSLTALSSDWYWEQDEHFRFTRLISNDVTPPWRQDRDEVIGRCRWEVPDLQPLQGGWEPHRATLEAHQPFRNFECADVANPAAPRYLSVSGEPIFDRDGCFAGYRGTARDISDSKRAQQEILRLNAELEERVHERTAQLQAANRELEAFSYSIAHDLRAPLSSIDGFSSALQGSAGDALGERAQHFLKRIRAGVRQMSELTDGLLALASLSRADLCVQPVDIAELARAALDACQEGAPERLVEIVVAPRLPAGGDPRLLAQLVGNLVGNAWKFTSRHAHARIEVGGAQDADGQWVYFVRDDGAGFDMAYASRMFEAFRRMHAADEFEGTGIGLAIAHRIVTRHGGRIWAESAPDRGATFYFTLGAGAAAPQ